MKRDNLLLIGNQISEWNEPDVMYWKHVVLWCCKQSDLEN